MNCGSTIPPTSGDQVSLWPRLTPSGARVPSRSCGTKLNMNDAQRMQRSRNAMRCGDVRSPKKGSSTQAWTRCSEQ